MGALTGVYYSAYARERIRAAQSVCDRHVTSAWTGCCLACGRPGPCPDRLEAEQILVRYRRLPRRLPGASLDGRTSPWDGRAGFHWFGHGGSPR